MMKTTKEKGMKNMEEGTRDEVEVRTKRKRRGKKVEREMFLKERSKYTRITQGGTKPK